MQKKIKERDASKNSSKLKENNLILQKTQQKFMNEFQKNDFKDKDMKSIWKNQEKFGFINYQ